MPSPSRSSPCGRLGRSPRRGADVGAVEVGRVARDAGTVVRVAARPLDCAVLEADHAPTARAADVYLAAQHPDLTEPAADAPAASLLARADPAGKAARVTAADAARGDVPDDHPTDAAEVATLADRGCLRPRTRAPASSVAKSTATTESVSVLMTSSSPCGDRPAPGLPRASHRPLLSTYVVHPKNGVGSHGSSNTETHWFAPSRARYRAEAETSRGLGTIGTGFGAKTGFTSGVVVGVPGRVGSS
jgi:hypothetical protein